jgi:modification methylase
VLTDSKRRWHRAVVAPTDRSLRRCRGSIHKLGATLQNAPSCNGWTWWHYEDRRRAEADRRAAPDLLLATQP